MYQQLAQECIAMEREKGRIKQDCNLMAGWDRKKIEQLEQENMTIRQEKDRAKQDYDLIAIDRDQQKKEKE